MSADLIASEGPAQVISPEAMLNLVSRPQPASAKDAAQQFEALLIATLLRAARESSSGAWGDDEDNSSSTMLDLAGQQLSQMMARQGGFGLTHLIVQGLGSTTAGPPPALAPAAQNLPPGQANH